VARRDQRQSRNLAVYKALYQAGISIIGLPLVATPPANTSVSANIFYAKRIANLGPGALYALEGPNEPSNFPIAYNGVSSGSPSTTFVPVAQFQRDYYAAIKADSTLANVPVWTPTLVGAEPDNSGLQYLKVPTPLPSGVLMAAGTVFADVLNMHVYPMYAVGAAQSIDPVNGDALMVALTGDFVNTWHGYAGYTQAQANALPRAITEFGYAATGGSPGGRTVDINTQGRNILNGFMNAWNEGFIAFTIYTFYEQGDGFGLFTGPGVPKSLWNNVTNWDFSAGTPMPISPTNVGITFGSTQGVVNVYDPVVSSTPILTVLNTNSVSVVLNDYPIVVEALSASALTPANAPAKSAPEAAEKSQ
jgi:hypothetical protein